jgi:ribonuclease HI
VIRLFTDGASRGNPGPAAAGWHAERQDGTPICEGHRRLSDCTNNEAEYRAVLLGLEDLLARGLAGESLELCGDSQLILRQLAGRYRVKAEDLRPFWQQAQDMLKQFGAVRFVELPRERNARADALANAAYGDAAATPSGRNESLRTVAKRLVAAVESANRAEAMRALAELESFVDALPGRSGPR